MGFISKKAFKLYVVKPKCTTANIVINIDITNTSKKNESVQKEGDYREENSYYIPPKI